MRRLGIPRRLRRLRRLRLAQQLLVLRAARGVARRELRPLLVDAAHVASIAADTVCVVGDAIVGKPGDRSEARGMITRMLGRRHRTITGVCIRNRAGRRLLFSDAAEVRMGDLGTDRIEAYLDSGEWVGKAGGYNLEDRIADGWPIECDGDPSTVMGLPIRRLIPLLEDLVTSEERS